MSNYSDSFLDLFDQVIADLKQYNGTQGGYDDQKNRIKAVPDDYAATASSITSGFGQSTGKSIKRKEFSDKEEQGDQDDHNGSDESKQKRRQKFITKYLNCFAPGCTQILPDKKQLKKHLRKHRLSIWRCHVAGCKANFSRRYKIADHLHLAHSNLTRWPCGQCTQQYLTYKALTVHICLKHEAGIFACGYPICNFISASNRQEMINHYNSKHKELIFLCTFTGCDKAFKRFSELKRHRITHNSEKQFICSQCEKAFKRKESLVNHVHSKHSKLAK